MTTQRSKSFLIYIGGLISGIVLTFAFLIAFAKCTNVAKDPNLVLFEQPRQTIDATLFEVMQVLPDGSALATIEPDYTQVSHNESLWTVVLFQAKSGTSYYDRQIIRVPEGKCVRQIGTYKYETRMEITKTVPVVDFFDTNVSDL